MAFGTAQRLVEEDVGDLSRSRVDRSGSSSGGTPADRCGQWPSKTRGADSHHAQRAVSPREDAAPHSESISGVVADHDPASRQ